MSDIISDIAEMFTLYVSGMPHPLSDPLSAGQHHTPGQSSTHPPNEVILGRSLNEHTDRPLHFHHQEAVTRVGSRVFLGESGPLVGGTLPLTG